jgi:hypothetical protein
MGKIFGILALIIGLVAFLLMPFLFIVPYAIYIFPGVAVVLGIVGIATEEKKGMAIAGLVLGILAFICWFFLLPFFAVLLIMMGLGGFLP